jgi:lysophospholipase L1-like esterase
MYIQRTRGGQKINIVHIGDSHILGNFLTREVRDRLQREFGDVGRGIIFPYKLAGTNGPRDYLVSTNCTWHGGNCQKDLDEKTPYGISGFGLNTAHHNGEMTIRLRDTATSETKLFTKVTVFNRPNPKEYSIEVLDEVSGQSATLFMEGDHSRSYYFDRPVGQATVAARRTANTQKSLSIDGISLENELAGVIYHSIGVNGAKFMDYARAKYFAAQLGDMAPDLIILSFGTNEAQGKTDPGYLYRTMELLTKQLEDKCGTARIVLTTPADSYLRGKGFNPNMADVSAVIRKFARDKGFALWDLFNISGGENSAAAWKERGLMSGDSVHYSKLGYAVQGKLLYQSLIKNYNEFARQQPKP